MSKNGSFGLGIMGTPMVGHLTKADHEVFLFSTPGISAELVNFEIGQST